MISGDTARNDMDNFAWNLEIFATHHSDHDCIQLSNAQLRIRFQRVVEYIRNLPMNITCRFGRKHEIYDGVP